MRRRNALTTAAPLALLLALAGCETAGTGDAADAAASEGAPAAETAGATGEAPVAEPGGIVTPEEAGAAAAPDIQEGDVRDIYLALEGSEAQSASVIFSIDQNGNGDPSDDRALRLSPENNQCNPQEMTSFSFASGSAPVFGYEEARRGVTPATLPRFMAAKVTETMVAEGIAATPDDTFAQNICTRKLWERIVGARQAEARAQAEASQASGQ